MENIANHRVYGVARYEARWINKSFLVRLTATGILPCSNYRAQLEKRPERVLPPMWDMVFYIQDHCEKALCPFKSEVVMVNSTDANSLTIRDATGDVDVPILQPFEVLAEPSPLQFGGAQQHIVYAKLPHSSSHHGCIVVPEDTLVTAVHYRAFGPAPKSECEAFVNEHCSGLPESFAFRSGEIPWPLIQDA